MTNSFLFLLFSFGYILDKISKVIFYTHNNCEEIKISHQKLMCAV